jgi:hypothetical protein
MIIGDRGAKGSGQKINGEALGDSALFHVESVGGGPMGIARKASNHVPRRAFSRAPKMRNGDCRPASASTCLGSEEESSWHCEPRDLRARDGAAIAVQRPSSADPSEARLCFPGGGGRPRGAAERGQTSGRGGSCNSHTQ